jgi:hypothetical protein
VGQDAILRAGRRPAQSSRRSPILAQGLTTCQSDHYPYLIDCSAAPCSPITL